MNILIVDDNNDKIAKIVSVIESISKNFNIDTVIDSISAQFKLKELKYDLLLVDLLLPIRKDEEPVPNGGELLLKEITRNKKLKAPTIITGITQYEEHKENFSSIWKLLLFKNEDWVDDLKQIIKHVERSMQFQSDSLSIKKPAIIVEGKTDEVILKEAINIFKPEFNDKIDIKYQKSGGANWVANQIVVWAMSHSKNKKGELIKCIGLLDGDQAGIDANIEINRVVKSNSAGANSFKIIKLIPDYAIDTIPLYKKGLIIPITLEELYPINFWRYAEKKGWLEERQKLDNFLKDPKLWNKREQSLNDYIQTLDLSDEERIYLKSFKLSSKETVVKYIERLSLKEKQEVLKNFEKLINNTVSYLFN